MAELAVVCLCSQESVTIQFQSITALLSELFIFCERPNTWVFMQNLRSMNIKRLLWAGTDGEAGHCKSDEDTGLALTSSQTDRHSTKCFVQCRDGDAPWVSQEPEHICLQQAVRGQEDDHRAEPYVGVGQVRGDGRGILGRGISLVRGKKMWSWAQCAYEGNLEQSESLELKI